MSIVRAMVIDDERLAREKIRALLADHEDVQVVGECADGTTAVAEIRRLKPDLVFLDVQMPGQNGFDVLRKLKGSSVPAIIFVTAHDEYAIRAFEVEAVDYLLKPFDARRFSEALRRARKRAESGGMEPELPGRLLALIEELASERRAGPQWNRFVVKMRDRMTFVCTADVEWIEAEGKYVRLHCKATKHLVRESISEVEQRLDPSEFARIHRGTIVNLSKVVEIYRGFAGNYIVALTSGTTLTVSRRYWSKIRHLGGVR
jgi:two-component system, LytTR family, response regulator